VQHDQALEIIMNRKQRRTARMWNVRALPKPKEAQRIARETGGLVAASDGYLYTGATKEEGAAYDEKLRVVYGVLDAVEFLASIKMLPSEFVTYAAEHQRWWLLKEGAAIAPALDWLTGFARIVTV
jgi:hypothetical protein